PFIITRKYGYFLFCGQLRKKLVHSNSIFAIENVTAFIYFVCAYMDGSFISEFRSISVVSHKFEGANFYGIFVLSCSNSLSYLLFKFIEGADVVFIQNLI